jgi:glycyl-tRNA synthetase beta chain
MPLSGKFKGEFLGLPRVVLETAMAKHEKFFPVLNASGEITDEFISITNGGEPDTVRQGNEWVLNARFNDAKFFFDEDRRKTLAEFLDRCESIVFQEKLGTIRQRAGRLKWLAGLIAKETSVDSTFVGNSETAAELCKADLATGLVSELPSLQGKIGAEYARFEKLSEEICKGIGDHYELGGSEIGDILAFADQADRLAGFLGIGEAPTGSSDPYALRRAATMLIEFQRARPNCSQSIRGWIKCARDCYRDQGISLNGEEESNRLFLELLRSRYDAVFSEIPYDALDAAWSAACDEPVAKFSARAELLAKLSGDVEFVRTAKRPANIVEAAQKKGLRVNASPDSANLVEQEEKELFQAAAEARAKLSKPMDLVSEVEILRSLKKPIDDLFDKVMVMVDDENVRSNRLALLRDVDALFRRIGDFSRIVIEGD